MALGPGEYDHAVSVVKDLLGAKGVILYVIGGYAGDGFEAHLPSDEPLPVVTRRAAAVLRHIADQFERYAASAES